MSDTFALWAPSVSPLASPVPSQLPVSSEWENCSRPDPQDVPVPESESDRELDDAVQDEGPIQEEAEEEVPDEV
eukprot:6463180-Amphidinium_carterae.1